MKNMVIGKLKEKLAAIEHERWADWQKWVHGQGEEEPIHGNLIIPQYLVERWQHQIDTPYVDLSEKDKQSDRREVDRYWPLIEKCIVELEAKNKELITQRDFDWDRFKSRIARLKTKNKVILDFINIQDLKDLLNNYRRQVYRHQKSKRK